MKERMSISSKFLRAACALSVGLPMLSISGCGTIFYNTVPVGSFSGDLVVQWVAPNYFIYRQSTERPLVYTTSTGVKIQPRTMYTDGGSIPRLFWSAPSLAPWDFGPGYVIHDWLFEQHHCRESDWISFDLKRAADILAEAMKTQMVMTGKSDPTTVWAVHAAVESPVAESLWNNGKCGSLPPSPEADITNGKVPVTILRISL